MKNFITTISTTVRAFKLLSNPLIVEKLYKELADKVAMTQQPSTLLAAKDIFYHKHYMIQVVN